MHRRMNSTGKDKWMRILYYAHTELRLPMQFDVLIDAHVIVSIAAVHGESASEYCECYGLILMFRVAGASIRVELCEIL